MNEATSTTSTTNRTYRMKKSWRTYMFLLGALGVVPGALFFLMGLSWGSPMVAGIGLLVAGPMFWLGRLGRRAAVTLDQEGFVITWFRTRRFEWSQVSAVRRCEIVQSGGLAELAVGAAISSKSEGLKKPVEFQLSGQKSWIQIPAHALENSLELAETFEQKTSSTIVDDREAA